MSIVAELPARRQEGHIGRAAQNTTRQAHITCRHSGLRYSRVSFTCMLQRIELTGLSAKAPSLGGTDAGEGCVQKMSGAAARRPLVRKPWCTKNTARVCMHADHAPCSSDGSSGGSVWQGRQLTTACSCVAACNVRKPDGVLMFKKCKKSGQRTTIDGDVLYG